MYIINLDWLDTLDKGLLLGGSLTYRYEPLRLFDMDGIPSELESKDLEGIGRLSLGSRSVY